MLKEKVKGIIIGVLIGTILTGSVAFARNGSEMLEAIYSNIKIFIDGKQIDPRDVNGNSVEPFIYNGTTYLPVRAVGEAFGKQVSWDGNKKTVYVGVKPGEIQSWMDVCKPYEFYFGEEYLLSENKFFTMAGNEYTNGFILNTLQKTPTYALFNLNGKYNSLSFKVGHIDNTLVHDTKLNIYLDGIISKSLNIKGDGGIQNVNIPLNGATHMKLEIEGLPYIYMNSAKFGFADGVFN